MSELAPIAIQLYSLREALQKDFTGIVTKLAEKGYVGVEPVGMMAVDHAEAARLFKDLGLRVPSIHAPLPLGDDKAKIAEIVEAYDELEYLICPAYARDEFGTADGIKQVCDVLNQANAAAVEMGLTFGYHNHWWEYLDAEGKPAYKYMLEYLDPAIIFQVDVYWVKAAGHDPAAVVKELGTRAPLLHIKDGPANREDPMTAVGQGVVDIPAVVKAGAGVAEWHIVELDRCATDMLTAVEESYDYLVKEGLSRGNK
ncbi:MAG: sugar phosphate isomerase/epimerase [Anaerolineae bacterium]|nr:sugar phosphate isomerase/epimerase [Anaerolineae bacterium]